MASTTEVADILEANTAFYDAVRTGDFRRLERMWAQDRPVEVYRPGCEGNSGRENVLESWAELFASCGAPDIYPDDERVVMSKTVAVVFCTELFGEDNQSASNVWVRERGTWRITQHIVMLG